MNVTLNWLKTYTDFAYSARELADRLTMLGIEVESIKQLGTELTGVVVGKVTGIHPHPNADKLLLCHVDVGDDAALQIVCGAPDVREGMLAPVATVGAELPNGLKIKRAKLRGTISHGMLCSEKELGLSNDDAGLMELAEHIAPGTPLAGALGLDDIVFELEITPNRPDCLSLIGVAREIGADTGNPLKLPEVHLQENGGDVRENTSVTIEAPELCSRYAARVIRGVTIGQSPMWLQRRLESVGIGVINNIVDITNFVLMEYGHPLHAFDYQKLAENRIVVRRANRGEKLTTLDETERELDTTMLVIADAEKPVALAGIMGGEDSEITNATCDVLLESAHFQPASIRATAKTLGIHTEASYRFERGTDAEGVIPALNRAVQLIADFAGGTVCEGIVDVYPRQHQPIHIELRPERVNFVLGTQLEAGQMHDILSRLGFHVENANPDKYRFTAPTFRPDVTREIDLVEEIARVYGYDKIPTTLPKGNIPVPVPKPTVEIHKRIKQFLLSTGMMEVVNYSFCGPGSFDRIRLNENDVKREGLRLQNPLSPEMSLLRTTLLPSLLENARHNRNHQIDNIALFEISTVFIASKEPYRVTGILTGKVGGGVYEDAYRHPDFLDIKGIVEGLLEVSGINDYTLAKTAEPTFHPGRNAEVLLGKQHIGIFGEAHPEVLKNYNLPYRAYLFEFDLDALTENAEPVKRFEPISIYPKVQRDIAIVLDADIPSNLPIEFIKITGGELVESVRLFDVYEGEQVLAGKRSLAYTITYHSGTETLTDKLVNRVHGNVIKRLHQELGAELRM